MSNSETVLGKTNKKNVTWTYDSKNYKVPEWFPVEKMDIDTAEKLIEYKMKISEQWCEAKPTGQKNPRN